MSDINHRRHNRERAWQPGDPRISAKTYLAKALYGWGRSSTLADRHCGGSVGNDFTDGRNGMSVRVREAKKRGRANLRFHENQATRKLARSADSMQERDDA